MERFSLVKDNQKVQKISSVTDIHQTMINQTNSMFQSRSPKISKPLMRKNKEDTIRHIFLIVHGARCVSKDVVEIAYSFVWTIVQNNNMMKFLDWRLTILT